jgi:hypothetical protein
MLAGGPAVAVAENVTAAAPGAVAVTTFCPVVVPRVSVVLARPKASVFTVVAESVPPPAVTANVTETLPSGVPPADHNPTANGRVRVDPTGAVCPFPATTLSVRIFAVAIATVVANAAASPTAAVVVAFPMTFLLSDPR